jgi:hypothetical protein
MRYRLAGLIIMSGVLFAGCNKPAAPLEYTSACDAANDGKDFAVTGYLNDQGSTFCSNIGGGPVTCGFPFLQKLGDAKGFTAYIAEGSSADEVENLANGYKKEDIKIHDHTGKIISLNDKVTLSGKMSVQKDPSPQHNDTCFVTVRRIDKQ